MKKVLFLVVFISITSSSLLAQINTAKEITTEKYTAASAVRSGIALGGIGTGSIELRKDGNFYNWSIFNNYPHGAGPSLDFPVLPNKEVSDSFLFFLVRYQVEGEKPKLKLLQINNSLEEAGMEGISYYYPWMDAVENIEYSGRFPFVNIKFTDSEMPFDIKMEAFSPFIPHDVENSSLPGVYFNFEIEATTNKPVDVVLLGSLRNLVGYDEIEKEFTSTLINENNFKFFAHSVDGIDTSKSSFGEMGLGAIGGEEISYYLGWEHKHPYYEKLLVENKLANIDETKKRNITTEEGKRIGRLGKFDNDQRCFSSVAASHQLKSGETIKQTFFMNWNFPNNYGAIKGKEPATSYKKAWKNGFGTNLELTKNIGHYYQNKFENIHEIVRYFANNNKLLKSKSAQFVADMYQSDVDLVVLNQVNSHLNTFITSSTLTKGKSFVIREGLTSSQSWGPTATADVALYGSQMAIALFPELQKSMMKSHRDLQSQKGEIHHGLALDPDFSRDGTWGIYDRIDLVPNYIQMVLRDYFWTNDKEYLIEMWPSIELGIEYMLNHVDKDGDFMPEMDGIMCSYDNFPMYGLASYIQSQWIVALTMASEAAKDMNAVKLQKKYKNIAEKGSKLMEEKLWNGSYYRLSNDYLGDKGIDEGCLTDQLIGQWTAHTTGFGYLFKEERVKTALNSILEMSFMDNSFLRNCSWKEHAELFPIHTSNLWVDQANTPWTGVELAFASFLIYENMVDEGLKVIEAIDKRYRKNGLYWDHQEFGGHYYRPMASWSIMNAFLGLSINRGVYSFAPKNDNNNFKLFFSGPQGTAFYHQKENNFVGIEALTGKQVMSEINVQLKINQYKNIKVTLNNIDVIPKKVSYSNNTLNLVFSRNITIKEGQILKILFNE